LGRLSASAEQLVDGENIESAQALNHTVQNINGCSCIIERSVVWRNMCIEILRQSP
jgi:hypothetical protein